MLGDRSAELTFNYGYINLPTTSAVRRAGDADTESTCATEPPSDGHVAHASPSAFAPVGADPDPILSMRDAFIVDPCEDKLNLAVGVYRTSEGKPLVLRCVKEAEVEIQADVAAGRTDKEYLPARGMQPFCDASLKLLLGDAVDAALDEGRVVSSQSLSGLGGLHLAARMISECMPANATVHLPGPTWPIHPDIFKAVGVRTASYPYYDASTCGFDAEGMLAALGAMPPGSVVLFHACAHNPTGVDPSAEQWEAIASVVAERRLVPLIDSAYQGLASGDLSKDGAGAQVLASIPNVEMMVCQSYAKNMGLYGERVGCFTMVLNDATLAEKAREQLARVIRLTYSSPPLHGAAIAANILLNPERRKMWATEVREMAARLHEMRVALSEELAKVECPPPRGTKLASWSHVMDQIGMFTYSGLTPQQVDVLRERHHIYMPQDGRISMASLTTTSCKKLAIAIKDVVCCEAEKIGDEPPAKRQHVGS